VKTNLHTLTAQGVTTSGMFSQRENNSKKVFFSKLSLATPA